MKIYVAAPWVHKDEADTVAEELTGKGLSVVSRWHHSEHDKNIYEAPVKVMFEEAQKDFLDILEADTLVYLNLAKSEGKATELGIALARGYDIYVVGGTQNNVFLHLPQVNHKESLEEVIQCLLT